MCLFSYMQIKVIARFNPKAPRTEYNLLKISSILVWKCIARKTSP